MGGAAASLVADGDGLWLAVGASATEHRGWDADRLLRRSRRPPRSTLPCTTDDQPGSSSRSRTTGSWPTRRSEARTATRSSLTWRRRFPRCLADGLTYRFPLREGIRRYSTGDPVRPEDFRYGLERSVALDRSLAGLFGAIVGVRGLQAGPVHLRPVGSIVVDDRSVTFHLARPDPDLPFKLALPAAFPVPAATPVEDQGRTPLPATGPYDDRGGRRRGHRAGAERAVPRVGAARLSPRGSWTRSRGASGKKRGGAFDRLKAGELDLMTDRHRARGPRVLHAAPTRTRSCAGRAWPRSTSAWTLAGTVQRRAGAAGPELRDRPSPRGRSARRPDEPAPDVSDRCRRTSRGTSRSVRTPSIPSSGVWSAPDLDAARALIEDADAAGEKVTVWVSRAPSRSRRGHGVRRRRAERARPAGGSEGRGRPRCTGAGSTRVSRRRSG